MKKVISLAGPAAALIALKCPFCILALAGISAGIGSLLPVIQGLYWIIILGLGGSFAWFLFRSWKENRLSVWIFALGLIGFAGLIHQVATESGGIFAWLPAIGLTGASIASWMGKRKAVASCCNPSTQTAEKST